MDANLVNVSRRRFLQTAAASMPLWGASRLQADQAERPKVAALFTIFRFRSHAYNILENFLGEYTFRGRLTDPGVDVVSFYADQFPDGDMARDVARKYGIPLYDSIEDALCLGGDELAVDAVLSIVEHGDYPYNDLHQQLYPRKEFFDAAVAVMKRSGRYVPFFNDKHLSHRWDWAKEMFDVSRDAGFPLLAGSSVPLAQRVPPFELPEGAEIAEAVSIHGGGLESYDFHGLEVLQSVVEARRGGESGVSKVELLIGDKFEAELKAGRWSEDLVDAAMQAEQNLDMRRQPYPRSQTTKAVRRSRRPVQPPSGPHAIVVTYKDGLQGTVLRMGSSADRWNFACRLKGKSEPLATAYFNSPWGNRGLFKALSHSAQHMFRTGNEPYPAERTLLTTGVLDAAMRSLKEGKPLDTPHLELAYQPTDWRRFRENGQTWKTLTADVAQPTDFSPEQALRRP